MNSVLETDAGIDAPPVSVDVIYKTCPQCGAPVRLLPVPSPDAVRGTLWSDGYLQNPDLPELPILGKCRACGAMGHLAELPEMAEPPPPAPGIDHTFAPLTLDDYAALLENLRDISLQFHAYLRIRFWQLNNHRRRSDNDPPPLSEVERDNLIELLNLLGDADADRLITAEILRQLQEFDAAESVLARSFGDQVSPIAQRLRELVRDRRAELVELYAGASTPHQGP